MSPRTPSSKRVGVSGVVKHKRPAHKTKAPLPADVSLFARALEDVNREIPTHTPTYDGSFRPPFAITRAVWDRVRNRVLKEVGDLYKTSGDARKVMVLNIMSYAAHLCAASIAMARNANRLTVTADHVRRVLPVSAFGHLSAVAHAMDIPTACSMGMGVLNNPLQLGSDARPKHAGKRAAAAATKTAAASGDAKPSPQPPAETAAPEKPAPAASSAPSTPAPSSPVAPASRDAGDGESATQNVWDA